MSPRQQAASVARLPAQDAHQHADRACIALESGALVFWSPEERLRGSGARVQIIDVFALQVAS